MPKTIDLATEEKDQTFKLGTKASNPSLLKERTSALINCSSGKGGGDGLEPA